MKKLCVLQVAPNGPTLEHVEMFGDMADSDFYFVTHDAAHPDALKFCPNTSWAETRNILVEMVPREYEYYAFVDYDYEIESLIGMSVPEHIISDLNLFHPAVLVPYPGEGNITPLTTDLKYRDSRNYSVWLFTHCGMKIVHHTVLDWFFPMVTQFDGGFSASHLFNILEIPFLKNIVLSHKLIYHNRVSDSSSAPHNREAKRSLRNMDRMWQWIAPALEIHDFAGSKRAVDIKNYFVKLCRRKQHEPEVNQSHNINYNDPHLLRLFFDPKHEYFEDKGF